MPTFEPRNPDFRTAVGRHFVAQRYLALLGVELAAVEPGMAEFHVPFRPEVGQQNGFFHGGVVGGIAEAVMGTAAATLIAPNANVLGAEYTINLLAPGVGAALHAFGEVIKPGRRLIVCRADVFAVGEDGKTTLCAIAQGAMAVNEGEFTAAE